jgi:hypothetical protein
MATGSRTLWKGAITFGLVHIPVGLHTASVEQGIDFDWLDKRSMDPVGYKRINKKTGKEIDKENIVKGFEYEDGHYVIISPEEIETAFPRTTQTIEIQMFVDASESALFVYLERPYYVAPINKGPQGVRVAARDAGEDGQGRRGQGGNRDEAAPGCPGAVRAGAGVEPDALGGRGQGARRAWTCRPAGCEGAEDRPGRDEDGHSNWSKNMSGRVGA